MTLAEISQAVGVTATGGDATRQFTDIVTDSRRITNGVLFIAFKGEKFDGADFVQEAVAQGATGIMVREDCAEEKLIGLTVPLWRVPDTLTAYQQIARTWREKFSLPVIAVTGSNGKTTTKDLTAAVLSAKGKVHKTHANFNNEIGLPLTLLGIDADCDYAVTEIGTRGLHQIEVLAKIARPTIGIVTNVGETHLELLGTVDNIARAKSELVAAIPAGGCVILNADDARVAAMRDIAQPNVTIITYGIEKPADIRAEAIRTENDVTKFMITRQGERHEYILPLVGRHNVYNALAAIAAGFYLGLTPEEIHTGLRNLECTGMRFAVENRGLYSVVNDAYNASPLSMRAAIETLTSLAAGGKIAVLGDMLELGDDAPRLHEEIGKLLGKHNFSALITYGELAKHIANGAKTAGVAEVYTADSHQDAAQKLQEIMRPGDTILFKGSRGMQMEKIIDLVDWTTGTQAHFLNGEDLLEGVVDMADLVGDVTR